MNEYEKEDMHDAQLTKTSNLSTEKYFVSLGTWLKIARSQRQHGPCVHRNNALDDLQAKPNPVDRVVT